LNLKATMFIFSHIYIYIYTLYFYEDDGTASDEQVFVDSGCRKCPVEGTFIAPPNPSLA
jgi:hypothetical protein